MALALASSSRMTTLPISTRLLMSVMRSPHGHDGRGARQRPPDLIATRWWRTEWRRPTGHRAGGRGTWLASRWGRTRWWSCSWPRAAAAALTRAIEGADLEPPGEDLRVVQAEPFHHVGLDHQWMVVGGLFDQLLEGVFLRFDELGHVSPGTLARDEMFLNQLAQGLCAVKNVHAELRAEGDVAVVVATDVLGPQRDHLQRAAAIVLGLLGNRQRHGLLVEVLDDLERHRYRRLGRLLQRRPRRRDLVAVRALHHAQRLGRAHARRHVAGARAERVLADGGADAIPGLADLGHRALAIERLDGFARTERELPARALVELAVIQEARQHRRPRGAGNDRQVLAGQQTFGDVVVDRVTEKTAVLAVGLADRQLAEMTRNERDEGVLVTHHPAAVELGAC